MSIKLGKSAKELRERIAEADSWLKDNVDLPLRDFEEITRYRNILCIRLKILDKPKIWNLKPKW